MIFSMASADRPNACSTDPYSRASNCAMARSSAGTRRRCANASAAEESSALVRSIVNKAHRTSRGSSFKAAASISRPERSFHTRLSSGRSRASAPHPCNTSNRRDGCRSIKPLANSCQTRSGTSASTSPASTIVLSSFWVSGSTLKSPKRAAKRASRRIRTGSSEKAGPTCRKTRLAKSRCPPNGSIKRPSAAWAIALMVRSRRSRSSSRLTSGAA